MPDLEPNNINHAFETSQRNHAGFGKFIREGNRIFWSTEDYVMHKHMLAESGIQNPDDAGRFKGRVVSGSKIIRIYGPSSDLGLPQTIDQRNRTLELWKEVAASQNINTKPESVNDIWEAIDTTP